MTAGEHWFSTDRVLVYAAFCADFGPMNLAAGLLLLSYVFFLAIFFFALMGIVLCCDVFLFYVRADFGLMDLAAGLISGLILLCSVSCAMATSSACDILVFFLNCVFCSCLSVRLALNSSRTNLLSNTH